MILLGVFFSCLALLVPFITIEIPWGNEVWFFQSIAELQKSFHLAPTLNGMNFAGPNPIAATVLSLLPMTDLLSFRVVSVLLGCLVSLSVFVFCASLWDNRSGVFSALFTMTSWGFVVSFGTIGPTVIPASIAVLSFLLFAQIYLKGLNSWWYLLSYLLMCIAVATGGWIPLAFFAFSIIFLILLDLSPGKFLSIKPAHGILFIGGFIAVLYLSARIFEGSAYTKTLFSYASGQGFFSRAGIWAQYNLPWLVLVIPAWAYGEGPKEGGSWRSLLAPKTGYAIGALAVILSQNFQEGYAVLSIPFGGILIGYWMSKGFLIRQSLQKVRTVSFIATAGLLILSALAVLSAGPIRESIMELSLDASQGAVLAGLFAGSALLLWFAKKQYAGAIVVLGMAAVLCLSWYSALILIPRDAQKPLAYMNQIRSFVPMLVFKDDLDMRGFTAYAGAEPIVVGEKMVPVGDSAYLAVRTADLKALVKDLSTRMRAEVISSFSGRATYALIRVSPPVPRRQSDG